MQRERRVEGFVRRPVGDELDADEEAAATNVADRVSDGIDGTQCIAQRSLQRGAVAVDALDQTVALG